MNRLIDNRLEDYVYRGKKVTDHLKAFFVPFAFISMVPFVCGTLLSLLLLVYIPRDIFSTNAASWQIAFPGNLILTIVLIYFLGGALKGLAGLGMALICVPVVGLLYDPVLAATIVSIPLIVSNVRQGLFSSKLYCTVRRYKPFILAMSIAMGPSVYFSTLIPSTYISMLLGFLAITFALMNLGFKLPTIPDSKDYAAQVSFGAAAGFAGGLSGLIAIPLAFYVIGRNIEKHNAVALMGLAFLISGVTLFAGHFSNGNLSYQLLLLSIAATIPGLVGTFIGERFRSRINTNVFRKIVLLVVLAIGCKILIVQCDRHVDNSVIEARFAITS